MFNVGNSCPLRRCRTTLHESQPQASKRVASTAAALWRSHSSTTIVASSFFPATRLLSTRRGYGGFMRVSQAFCGKSGPVTAGLARRFSVKRRESGISGHFQHLCQNAVNGKNRFHSCCPVCFEASRSSYGVETTTVDVARFPLSIGLLRCP